MTAMLSILDRIDGWFLATSHRGIVVRVTVAGDSRETAAVFGVALLRRRLA